MELVLWQALLQQGHSDNRETYGDTEIMKKNAPLIAFVVAAVLVTVVTLSALHKDTKNLEFQGFGVSIKTK
jgi:hypothetical protein